MDPNCKQTYTPHSSYVNFTTQTNPYGTATSIPQSSYAGPNITQGANFSQPPNSFQHPQPGGFGSYPAEQEYVQHSTGSVRHSPGLMPDNPCYVPQSRQMQTTQFANASYCQPVVSQHVEYNPTQANLSYPQQEYVENEQFPNTAPSTNLDRISPENWDFMQQNNNTCATNSFDKTDYPPQSVQTIQQEEQNAVPDSTTPVLHSEQNTETMLQQSSTTEANSNSMLSVDIVTNVKNFDTPLDTCSVEKGTSVSGCTTQLDGTDSVKDNASEDTQVDDLYGEVSACKIKKEKESASLEEGDCVGSIAMCKKEKRTKDDDDEFSQFQSPPVKTLKNIKLEKISTPFQDFFESYVKLEKKEIEQKLKGNEKTKPAAKETKKSVFDDPHDRSLDSFENLHIKTEPKHNTLKKLSVCVKREPKSNESKSEKGQINQNDSDLEDDGVSECSTNDKPVEEIENRRSARLRSTSQKKKEGNDKRKRGITRSSQKEAEKKAVGEKEKNLRRNAPRNAKIQVAQKQVKETSKAGKAVKRKNMAKATSKKTKNVQKGRGNKAKTVQSSNDDDDDDYNDDNTSIESSDDSDWTPIEGTGRKKKKISRTLSSDENSENSGDEISSKKKRKISKGSSIKKTTANKKVPVKVAFTNLKKAVSLIPYATGKSVESPKSSASTTENESQKSSANPTVSNTASSKEPEVKPLVKDESGSNGEAPVHKFQKGDFVIHSKDLEGLGPDHKKWKYPIWKIYSASLSQRFDPVEFEGRMCHEVTMMYANWKPNSKSEYKAVKVKHLSHAKKKDLIEILPEFKPRPDVLENLNNHEVMNSFTVLLQTLTSVVLQKNFIDEVLQAKSDYHIGSLEIIQKLLDDAKSALLKQQKFCHPYQKALDTYPRIHEEITIGQGQSCRALQNSTERATRVIKFSGPCYNPDTLCLNEDDVASTEKFMTSLKGSQLSMQYHPLQHYKYHLLQICTKKVESVKEKDDTGTSNREIVAKCLDDKAWVQKNFWKLHFLLLEAGAEPLIKEESL